MWKKWANYFWIHIIESMTRKGYLVRVVGSMKSSTDIGIQVANQEKRTERHCAVPHCLASHSSQHYGSLWKYLLGREFSIAIYWDLRVIEGQRRHDSAQPQSNTALATLVTWSKKPHKKDWFWRPAKRQVGGNHGYLLIFNNLFLFYKWFKYETYKQEWTGYTWKCIFHKHFLKCQWTKFYIILRM